LSTQAIHSTVNGLIDNHCQNQRIINGKITQKNQEFILILLNNIIHMKDRVSHMINVILFQYFFVIFGIYKAAMKFGILLKRNQKPA
jgi:hypothetical protein